MANILVHDIDAVEYFDYFITNSAKDTFNILKINGDLDTIWEYIDSFDEISDEEISDLFSTLNGMNTFAEVLGFDSWDAYMNYRVDSLQ